MSHPLPARFEDADFLAELQKPHGERKMPCHQMMHAQAVEVWKQFAKMPDRCHY